MDEHNESVEAATPANKFHMMELSEGWAPLCKILNVKVPNEPFPRANDAEAVEGVASQIMFEAVWRWVVILSTVGLTGYGLWRRART